LLGAFLWRVRPRGEGHPQNVGSDSVIVSTFKVSNTKWDWRRLFDATWFQWRKFTLTLQIIYTCWNHFCTLVLKLNKALTIYLTLIHPATKLPCFNSRTHLQNYASSLPTLQTLQVGISPKLVWILKIKHLKRYNLKKESLLE
jgi:maltodextrin utilization protein YvdJ